MFFTLKPLFNELVFVLHKYVYTIRLNVLLLSFSGSHDDNKTKNSCNCNI